MKLLTRFFTQLYQYATVLIIVGSPLFFIPKVGFPGETTYHIVMMVLVFLALFSYVFVATVTRSWHSVSRLEFISYVAFSLAVVASCIFAKTPSILFFGEAFNQYSGAALLTLPAIMYLVRTLPDRTRQKMKYVMLGILGVSSFVFVMAVMVGGAFAENVRVIFSGFSSTLSFGVYLGLFSLLSFYYVRKSPIKKRYKVPVIVTALLFVAWAVTLSSQNSVRPNLTSTLAVGKDVLMEDGLFGIGAGNFSRAWQLHKPQDVINSAYFGYDFFQGADTMTTFLVTLGIVGLVAFMMLTLSALYSTLVSYRQNKEGDEHIILGVLALTLLYFISVAWLVPPDCREAS
jgi:MFS family permease